MWRASHSVTCLSVCLCVCVCCDVACAHDDMVCVLFATATNGRRAEVWYIQLDEGRWVHARTQQSAVSWAVSESQPTTWVVLTHTSAHTHTHYSTHTLTQTRHTHTHTTAHTHVTLLTFYVVMEWVLIVTVGRTRWTPASVSEAGRTRKTGHCG